jgi:hypothetical protein
MFGSNIHAILKRCRWLLSNVRLVDLLVVVHFHLNLLTLLNSYVMYDECMLGCYVMYDECLFGSNIHVVEAIIK